MAELVVREPAEEPPKLLSVGAPGLVEGDDRGERLADAALGRVVQGDLEDVVAGGVGLRRRDLCPRGAGELAEASGVADLIVRGGATAIDQRSRGGAQRQPARELVEGGD